ncbi:MAG: hypothetical protein IT438_14600 [Phycisphaerales bacterium]|nr:hypothetical protein [Phycisphaerales bacterium]
MPNDALSTLAEALLNAQFVALRKLTALLDTCDSPAETRRIAAAILRFRCPAPTPADPPHTPPTPPSQAPVHHAAPRPDPLSSSELQALALALPFVPAHKFKHENSPAYWRNALALRIQTNLKNAPSPDPIGPLGRAPGPATRAGPAPAPA